MNERTYLQHVESILLGSEEGRGVRSARGENCKLPDRYILVVVPCWT